MTARKIARSAALATIAVAGSVSLATAQGARGPNPNAPRLMVSACRISDKVLAIQCADKLRSTIEGDVSYRTLYVLPKADVENVLSASGYDPAGALASGDATALAKQIRADEYIDATLERAGAGFKLTASLVLQRDPNLIQPLGSWENAKLDGVMGGASKAFQDAHNRTFDRQKACASLARERKYPEASKEATEGIKDYPNTTWLRYCQLGILKDQKAADAAIVKVADEIRTIDPTSKGALQELVLRYEAMGNKPKKIEMLMLLQKADTVNPRLCADIANDLAAEGKFAEAKPIAEKCVASNPGDMNLVRTYWNILAAVQDNKKALEVGDMMAQMDTAAADSAYFARSMGLAMAMSDTVRAADVMHKGGVKFPKNVYFPKTEAGLFQVMNKNAEATAASRRVLAINPKEPGIRVRIASAFLKATPPQIDAAIAMAREMLANGEDKDQVAGIAVGAGDELRKVPDQLKAGGADAAAQAAAWEKAYVELAWADTLAKGTKVAAQAKFLMGLAALSVGQGHLINAGATVTKVIDEIKATKPDAAKQKAMVDRVYAEACVLVAKANDYFVTAQVALPAGGSFAPDATRQTMGALMQMNTSVDQMNKGYHCKP